MRLPRKYWLIFRKGDHWIQFFLNKEFGHVFVLTKDKYNWFKIDPEIRQFEVEIMPHRVESNLPRIYLESGMTVLEVETQNIYRSFFGNFSLIYCISMVKYILGINISAITPRGLYRRLTKMLRTTRYTGGVKNVKIIL